MYQGALGVDVPVVANANSFARCRLFSRSLTLALNASFSLFTASSSALCNAASSYLAWASAALELGLLVMAACGATEAASATFEDTELRCGYAYAPCCETCGEDVMELERKPDAEVEFCLLMSGRDISMLGRALACTD
jgi:hypothetical protein